MNFGTRPLKSRFFMKQSEIDLFNKCRSFTRHKEAEAEGLYPYFKAIESGDP